MHTDRLVTWWQINTCRARFEFIQKGRSRLVQHGECIVGFRPMTGPSLSVSLSIMSMHHENGCQDQEVVERTSKAWCRSEMRLPTSCRIGPVLIARLLFN
jgi:hypothetical protein